MQEVQGTVAETKVRGRILIVDDENGPRQALRMLLKEDHEVFLGRDIMEDRNYSEEIAYAIDQEVRSIIDECFEHAKQILTDNRDRLEEITALLLEKEVLDGDELGALLGYAKKEVPSAEEEQEEEEESSAYAEPEEEVTEEDDEDAEEVSEEIESEENGSDQEEVEEKDTNDEKK